MVKKHAKKTAQKTVLITGASRGLGLEFVRQYLNDGWRVIATSQKPEKAKTLLQLIKDGAPLSLFQLDVTDEKSVTRLAKGLAKAKIDVLINNSGVAVEPSKKLAKAHPLSPVADEDFMATLAVNTLGPVRVAEALLPAIQKAKGRIINISSTAGSIAALNPFGVQYMAYGISKAGLNFAVHAGASLLGKKTIITNLCPGWVRTEMGGKAAPLSAEESVAAMRKTIAKLTLKDSGRFVDRFGKTIPW